MVLIIVANGFIGASFGMIIFTSAIRAIPQHLFWAARVDGASGLAIVRHITLPAIRWQISFVTIYQALSLLVSFEYIWLITDGGPFYDTTVFALYVYQRAFDSGQYAYGAALALGARADRHRGGAHPVAPDGHARAAAAAADRGHMSTAVLPLEQAPVDWQALAAQARFRRRLSMGLLYAAMALGALPVLVPYLWLVTVAFSGRTGASTFVLWRTLAVLLPALWSWSRSWAW